MQLFAGGEEFAKKKDIVNPNLLKGTANWDSQSWSSYWNNKKSGSKDYLGNDQIQINTAWTGPVHTINVKSGDSITISGIVKLNIGACQIGIPAGDTKYNDTAVVVTRSPQIFVDGQSRGTGYINITDQNYHVLSATYEVTQGGTLNPRFESSSDQPNFLLSSMKAEYGYVATDWCPAREDFLMANTPFLPTNIQHTDTGYNADNSTEGWLVVEGSIANSPDSTEGWQMLFTIKINDTTFAQFLFAFNSASLYIRYKGGSPAVWSSWLKLNATPVNPSK